VDLVELLFIIAASMKENIIVVDYQGGEEASVFWNLSFALELIDFFYFNGFISFHIK